MALGADFGTALGETPAKVAVFGAARGLRRAPSTRTHGRLSMGLNVPMLRASLNLVLEREPNMTARFYDILFARHPEARQMFERNSREKQAKMLAAALIAVMDHLDDAPWLEATLSALGERHRGYGVRDEMYPWVGDALIAAIAAISGDDWTSEIEREWIEAFGVIVTLMTRRAPKEQRASA
jgi:hemoglobin-like flavoprotein